jgi:cytochrome b6-f complex iron-sulfur subunit
MAKRPSVKEILEAARKGGAATPAGEAAPAAEVEASAAPVEDTGVVERSVAPAAAVNVPTAASLGRPLTVKEKLAAARAGGSSPPPAPAKKAAAPAPAAAPEAAEVEEAPAEPKAVPAPAKPLGRPMTLQEKLAAARGGAAAPAPAAGAAKPAAAKAVAAPAAKPAGARALPPLGEITDPKDLAEAARQASAKKAREIAAAAAPAKKPPAKSAPAKPGTVPPRPTRELAGAATEGRINRRGFFAGSFFVTWGVAWIVAAWSTFTAAASTMTLMTVRFLFPNVLAEPPSTIKVGLPSNYEPEEVSERFKAEWGFWIVRSTRYDGQDVIYALQSVCTHLGCPPNWLAAEQKFKCPCHGSGFYVSGINFEGPAPRPLERFKVALADDGQIQVDKSQKFQQELGQWSDPDSFIPA